MRHEKEGVDEFGRSIININKEDRENAEKRLHKEKVSFEKVTITKHVDGDTVYIKRQDGTEEKLRFIGVNTPETKHPTKGVEFYGKEASNYTKRELLGKTIYLEKDVSDKDKYDRLLRYIWLQEPTKINEKEIREKMFNARLLLDGYAQVSTFPPDVKYQDIFLKLQEEARENQIKDYGGKSK
jgi:micrococcal nuclease